LACWNALTSATAIPASATRIALWPATTRDITARSETGGQVHARVPSLVCETSHLATT
jgi:hypothetical protein